MRRLIRLVVFVLCGSAVALVPARAEEIVSGSARWPIAQKLIENEREAWRTYALRDVQASGRLLAGDYADVQPDGTALDRAGHLGFVPKANVEWYELDQFRVFRLSADAALVSYRARSRDRGSADEYRATVVSGWSRRAKTWLNTFYKETPTAPEAAPAAE
jgi:hypothetical protein